MIHLYYLICNSVAWFLVCLIVFKCVRNLFMIYIKPKLIPFRFKPESNSWAIVTGSTDGIGLEYAKKLAQNGFNLLLISRNMDKLQKVRQEILNEFPNCPSVDVIAFDFSSRNYKPIEEVLNNLPMIHVLVNNVGHAYWTTEYFTKVQPWVETEKLIDINLYSMTKMCHLVLPRMEMQKKGVIVNISSFSAFWPVPLLAVYGASKAYVDYLSRALNCEYRSRGIIIQSVLPQFVATNMTGLKPSCNTPSAKTYVDSAFKTIGHETQTTGYWNHRLKKFGLDIARSLSENLISRVVKIVSLQMRQINYKARGLNP